MTPQDIAIANRLAHEVLGRSLDDLAPQTRRLLVRLREMVLERAGAGGVAPEEVRFSRRDALAWCGWGSTQLAVHLERLIANEYVLVHRGGRGRTFVYELLWDGDGGDGGLRLNGLLDAETLTYDGNLSGVSGDLPATSRPDSGPVSVTSRPAAKRTTPDQSTANPGPLSSDDAHHTMADVTADAVVGAL